ncbi:hypothetical protein ACO0QE_001316 [Hanseniaspora vineae]
MAISKFFKKTFNLIYSSTSGEALTIQEAPDPSQPSVSTNTTAVGPSITRLNTKGLEAFDQSFNDKKFFRSFHIEHKGVKHSGASKTTGKQDKPAKTNKTTTTTKKHKEHKPKNTDPKAPNNSLTYIYLISEHLEKYKSASEERHSLSRGNSNSTSSVSSEATQEEIIISALTSNQRKAEERLKNQKTDILSFRSSNSIIGNNTEKIEKIDPNIVVIENHQKTGKQEKPKNKYNDQSTRKNMNERIVKILNLEKEKQEKEENEGNNNYEELQKDGEYAVDHSTNGLNHETSDASKMVKMKTIKDHSEIY